MSSAQQETSKGIISQEQGSSARDIQIPQASGSNPSPEGIGKFSGQPIGEAPAQLPDSSNITHLWFLMLALQYYLSKKPQLVWRREAIVMIAKKTLNRSCIYPFRELSRHARRTVPEVLELLEEFLQGIPH